MKVLWPHNFDPKTENSGCFMYTAAEGLAKIGIHVKTEYLGNLKNPVQLLRARQLVRKLSRSYDLVHAQYGSACALATSASYAPLVMTIRGNDWNLHRETYGVTWIHTRMARAMTQLSLKYYQMILCVSRRISEELKKHVLHKCFIEIHPSPINLLLWPTKKEIRPGPRPPFRLLFSVNCLSDPIKRTELLTKAVEIASRRLGKIELVYANGVPHKQMPALVSTCDAVACTSETEGWPNSVKEALACGLPFVSTDVSDLRCIAKKERTCRVVDADPEAFAQGLCDVLLAPWSPGLRRYVEKMDLNISSKNLKSLYQFILEQKRIPFSKKTKI